MGDNPVIPDNRADHIAAILQLDYRMQQLFRAGWPTSWLQLNMPLGSIRALLALEGSYANTPGGIADLLTVSRTTITGVLDRLEAEGLITRAIDVEDRRSFVLALTDSGRALIEQIDAVRREPLNQALLQIGEADLEALHRGLSALVEAMRKQRATSPESAENSPSQLTTQ